MHFFWSFKNNWAVYINFQWLILAGGHIFQKLDQLASQKWVPKSQIGWEHVPTVAIFLEPFMQGNPTSV